MKKPNKLSQNQQGMVSITVTVVFIMVIGLVVIGFSQTSRRNSREALDRQLSSQAYYAAETGVNDVMNTVAKRVEEGKEVLSQKECSDTGENGYTRDDGVVRKDGDDVDVQYTCLTVNSEPHNLEWSHVDDSSIVASYEAGGGATKLGTQGFKWKRTDSVTNAKLDDCPKPGTGNPWTNFPDSKTWSNKCPFGVVRVDLFPETPDTLKSAEEAAKATMTVFFYPTRNGSVQSVPYLSGSPNVYGGNVTQGEVRPASCDDEWCQVNITGLEFQKAHVRIKSLYVDSATFRVNAIEGTLKNSQVVIDATGRAQDVLRRIQVRISITGGNSRTYRNGFSDYVLQSGESLCKRFVSSQAYAQNRSSCSY